MSAPHPHIHEIDRYISVPRFETFRNYMAGYIDGAISLYQWNQQVEGSVHVMLGIIEIALRNALDGALTAIAREGSPRFDDWTVLGHQNFRYISKHDKGLLQIPPALSRIRDNLQEAHKAAHGKASRGGREYNHDDVVASLMFGTWVKLIGDEVSHAGQRPSWNSRLWASGLHAAFTGLSGAETDRVRLAVVIRYLHHIRNREAHHENLLTMDIPKFVASCTDLLHWIDPDFPVEWLRSDNLYALSRLDPRRKIEFRQVAFKLTGSTMGCGTVSARDMLHDLLEHASSHEGKVLFCNKIRVSKSSFGRINGIYLYADGLMAHGNVSAMGLIDDDDYIRYVDSGQYTRPKHWGATTDTRWYAIRNLHALPATEASKVIRRSDGSVLIDLFSGRRANFIYLT